MNENIINKQHRSKNGIWRDINYDMSQSADIARYLARNPYAFPGGYPLFAVTDDSGALCHQCCHSEYRQIRDAYPGDGWNVVAVSVNYEESDLVCDHCGRDIESAY